MHTPTSSGLRRLILCALISALAFLCALPVIIVGFAGLAFVPTFIAVIGIALPLSSLIIGWPILLLFGGKALLETITKWRRSRRRLDA